MLIFPKTKYAATKNEAQVYSFRLSALLRPLFDRLFGFFCVEKTADGVAPVHAFKESALII